METSECEQSEFRKTKSYSCCYGWDVRPEFFSERTVWFVSWKIHDIRLQWPGTAWLSSGNELHSSSPEEVRPCQALPWFLQGMNQAVLSLKKSLGLTRPWLLQGMNCTVHSLRKSGRVRPCHEFFREWPHTFLSLKNRDLANCTLWTHIHKHHPSPPPSFISRFR